MDLCIISACQTGSGKQEYGVGTRSFARSFAYAGASGTISTLWCVDDKATAEVLEEFYRSLQHEPKVAGSLTFAKRNYLEQCKSPDLANPFYWAGLVYCGKYNLAVTPTSKSISLENLAIIGTLISLFALTILVYRRKKVN